MISSSVSLECDHKHSNEYSKCKMTGFVMS
jgi:hypothetical protein